MHRHLGEVDGHLLNQIFLQVGLLLNLRPRIFLGMLFLRLHVFGVVTLVRLAWHIVVVGHQSQLFLLLCFSTVQDLDAERVHHVHFQEVEHGWSMNFVVYRLHDVELETLDLFDLQFLVGYLFVNSFHFQWVDVFELGRYEHGCNTDDVKVADFHFLFCELKVSVLQRDSQEESLVIAPEIGKHLNHPVNHTSA